MTGQQVDATMTLETAPPLVRVVLVDDDPAMRVLLRIVLETEDRFVVVGEAGDGSAGWRLILESAPDLAVVDLHMPELTGLDILQRVRASGSLTRIVIHSGDPEPLGPPHPDAFVLKDGNMDALVAVLTELATPRG
ncbi:MAG TPA: response regulator transcription factor [Nocardioides sp.]|nr:response regulator transcription factor [Nocardioides sp.]